MRKRDQIGYARCDVKAGETIAEINLATGKVTSKVLRFKPWGKIKMLRGLVRPRD